MIGKHGKLFEKIYGEEEGHLFKFQEYTKFQDEKEEPSKVPLPEWRKIYTDDYFALLNKAVSAEITGIIQYTNQHEKMAFLELRMKNTALEAITETNKAAGSKQNPQRNLHAGNGSPRKNQRTHLPPRRRSHIETRSTCQSSANTAQDFLRLDHALESSAITLYRQIIAEALKRGDTTTRRMFEDIIIQEEDHFWTFDDFVR